MERFMKQIVSNSLNLIASFQAIIDYLEYMDTHMVALVQKL